eukprot:scaffold551338_cov43-Prasinocladus_malaysianus.AAC.1
MATGKAMRSSPLNSARKQVSGDTLLTQKLIQDYGEANLAVARLAGSLTFRVADTGDTNATDS